MVDLQLYLHLIVILGISAIDPRPEGVARYIDHLTGEKVATKPSHAFYGRLPLTEIRDPTCKELQSVVSKQCSGIDEETGYSMGQFCGLGTTWNPEYQQCVRTPDEYITIDGIGKPFEDSPYPAIRPEGYETPFDEPGRKYVSIPKTQQAKTGRSLRRGSDCRKCRANRCRFPLTSEEGRRQAYLYVRLFRLIYEYTGEEPSKVFLRVKIRELIEKHLIHFSGKGIHDNGFFLPWHRWYIIEMETLLMQGQHIYRTAPNCDETFVGIPYFDWHNLKDGETPNEFINNAHDNLGHHFEDSLGQSNGVQGCPSNRGSSPMQQGALKGFRLIAAASSRYLHRCWKNDLYVEDDIHEALHSRYPDWRQFNQFRQRLMFQTGLHGSIHRMIGGVMNTQLSSNDPIFFCHHANVDKIWNDWQKQSRSHMKAFTNHIWVRYEEYVHMAGASHSADDVLNLAQQRYRAPGHDRKTFISAEYVDLDTSSMWGRGNTSTIRL